MHYAIRWFKCKLKPPKNDAEWSKAKIFWNLKIKHTFYVNNHNQKYFTCVCKFFPVSEQNSLCFPCLEKVRTKFPVFPVPWPPWRHTPWDQVHPPEQCMLGDTGNKRAVRILLECILVSWCVSKSKSTCNIIGKNVQLFHDNLRKGANNCWVTQIMKQFNG